MGQASSTRSPKRRIPHRGRANTMRSPQVIPAALKEARLSLPEYTLTQYDVKQLMKSFREAMAAERSDTRSSSSSESEAEEEMMEQIHGQFGPQPQARTTIRSTTSNASEDSGIDDNGHSPRQSLEDLSTSPTFRVIGEDTPIAQTPATPVVIPVLAFTPPAERIDLDKYIRPEPVQKGRRFIPKRFFGKKKERSSPRQRSKSLGFYDYATMEGLCFLLLFVPFLPH